MTASPPGKPFIIVLDWQHIHQRGTQFSRCDVATGLRLCTWPDYAVMRDTVDDRRYVVRRVRAKGQKPEHQRLESLDGYTWLLPTYNGHLKRAYAPAHFVVGPTGIYHVTRNDHTALCGWRFNGAAVLREPPEGTRECRVCWKSTWRCVP